MDNGTTRLRIVIGWVVVGAWVGSIIIDASIPDYDPPASIHLLMMLVAGALFGPKITGRSSGV